jgi:polysaccharide biosynthesis transport protein
VRFSTETQVLTISVRWVLAEQRQCAVVNVVIGSSRLKNLMLQAQKSSPDPDLSDPVAEEAGLADTAFFLIGVIRQQYHIILPVALITALIIASVCLTYLWVTPPTYIAKVQLVIDRGKSTFLQQQAVLPDAPIDSAQVESESQILMSGRIAALVVKNLHLTEDPEFAGTRVQLFDTLKKTLADFLRGIGLLTVDPVKSDSDPVSQAASVLLNNLQVNRLGISFILEINFQSHSPARAVQVANAIADAYIFDQMDSKYKMQRRASEWLQTRLNELRQQAVASEEAVNTYKAKNNIVTAGGAPISEQEIAELNRQLVEARTKTSDNLARLNRIENILRCADAAGHPGDRAGADSCPDKSGTDFYGAVSDLLTNPIVTKLRQQYLELVNREAEFSTRYGHDHAAVVNLRNQIRDIQNSILNELKRLAESYKSDYLISKQRQDAIDKDLAKSVAQSQEKSKAQAALRELESNAQGTRSVYEVFLQRYTESLQQQTYVTTEARIMAPAGAALQKVVLKPVVVAALSILGGLGLGFGVAFLRVAMDRVFRTSQQIETVLHVPCVALVPLVRANAQVVQTPVENNVAASDQRTRTIFRNSDVFWTVVDSPLSRFAEAIRSIKLSVDLQQVNGLSTVIGFTSSLPNEGKTTTAAAVALLMGQVGHRVIVVDCDLRNPSLTRALAPNATTGLVEVLCGEKSVEEVSWHCQVTGLKLLPAIVKPGLLHTNEILASAATKRLFEQLRLSYDYIVVDLPPLAPIIDVRATGHLMDFYFLVVEWGVTKTDIVSHTLRGVRLISEHLLGAVLNKTDMDQIAHYDRLRSEFYKNKHYGKYGYTT